MVGEACVSERFSPYCSRAPRPAPWWPSWPTWWSVWSRWRSSERNTGLDGTRRVLRLSTGRRSL